CDLKARRPSQSGSVQAPQEHAGPSCPWPRAGQRVSMTTVVPAIVPWRLIHHLQAMEFAYSGFTLSGNEAKCGWRNQARSESEREEDGKVLVTIAPYSALPSELPAPGESDPLPGIQALEAGDRIGLFHRAMGMTPSAPG